MNQTDRELLMWAAKAAGMISTAITKTILIGPEMKSINITIMMRPGMWIWTSIFSMMMPSTLGRLMVSSLSENFNI